MFVVMRDEGQVGQITEEAPGVVFVVMSRAEVAYHRQIPTDPVTSPRTAASQNMHGTAVQALFLYKDCRLRDRGFL
jgi:hypothetical protein